MNADHQFTEQFPVLAALNAESQRETQRIALDQLGLDYMTVDRLRADIQIARLAREAYMQGGLDARTRLGRYIASVMKP